MGSRTVRGSRGEGEKTVVVDVPVIMLLEFQQSKSYEKLEVPRIQLIVGVQDIPVVSQRHVPTVLSFVFQVQFLEVVDMPVVVQRQRSCILSKRKGCQHPCRVAGADPNGSVCSGRPWRFPCCSVLTQVSQVPVVEESDGPTVAAR